MDEMKPILAKIDNLKYEDLANLDYTTAFINETLRFAGPVPVSVPRIAIKDHQLGGKLNIRKGTGVTTIFAANNFNPEYFEDPHIFRPERFMEGGSGSE